MKKNKKNSISLGTIILIIIGIVIACSLLGETSYIRMKGSLNNSEAADGVLGYRGMIYSVALDSRPVSTENFYKLVRAAGYECRNFDDSIDSMDESGNYTAGNPSDIMNHLSLVAGNFDQNTTVIVNSTSYFFGRSSGSKRL